MLGKRNAGLILAAFGTVAASAAGYLKVVGPSPLRFESAPDSQAPLPPLAPPENTETQSTNTVAAAEAQVPTKPLASPPKIITTIAPTPTMGASQLQTTTENQLVPSPSSPENSSYTAQMLLQFFQQQSGKTNAVNPTVVAPLNFTLPPAGSTPSSSATYIQQ